MKHEDILERDIECWPQRLLEWYWAVKRDLPWRRTSDPYSIWVSEVMLQQTQVKTVIPYYHRFLERFPNLATLALATLEEVLELWRGLGYYSRARHLWEGARFVLEEEAGRLPEDYQSLLKIPGVGEYTAGALASFAFGERVPAVDGNVKRVVARLLAWEEAVETVKTSRYFREYLLGWQPVEHAGDFNQAMMELGATVCTPTSPNCSECPLLKGCQGFALGTPLSFPVKRIKEKVTEAIRPTLVLLRNGEVLLKKRPSKGLLGNLWEFPGEEILLERQKVRGENFALEGNTLRVAEEVSLYGSQGEELSQKTKNGFPWFSLYQNQVTDRSFDAVVEELLKQEVPVRGPLVHTFSHRRWRVYWIVLDLSGVECAGKSFSGEKSELVEEHVFRWVEEAELDRVALPVAFQKVWTETAALKMGSIQGTRR